MMINVTNSGKRVRLIRQDRIQFAGVGEKLAAISEAVEDMDLRRRLDQAVITLTEVRTRFGAVQK